MSAGRERHEWVRYRPRDFLEAPGSFGRRPDARWLAVPDALRSLLAGAWLQHQASLGVHFELSSRRGGVAGLARALGKQSDYLRRKLNGERWANIRDIAAWALELGPGIMPVPRSPDDLLPPPEFTARADDAGRP